MWKRGAQNRPFMSPTNLCGAVLLRKSAPSRERRLLSGYVFLERSRTGCESSKNICPARGESIFKTGCLNGQDICSKRSTANIPANISDGPKRLGAEPRWPNFLMRPPSWQRRLLAWEGINPVPLARLEQRFGIGNRVCLRGRDGRPSRT